MKARQLVPDMFNDTFQTTLKCEHQINPKSAETHLVPVAINDAQHVIVGCLSLLQLFNPFP